MFALSCGPPAVDVTDPWDPVRPEAYRNATILKAEEALVRRDIAGAREHFQDARSRNRRTTFATAAAGVGITSLMLLPDEDVTREVFVEHLGAERPDYDAARLVWEDNGMLFWFARGTRWDDDGDFQGVRSLVSPQLPFELDRFTSAAAFSTELERPFAETLTQLQGVTTTLSEIEDELGRAIDDEDFVYLYLPPELFHDATLGLQLGAAELGFVRGALGMMRTLYWGVTAYDASYTPQEVFVHRWNQVLNDPEDPEHVPEYTRLVDYGVAAWDARFGRDLVPNSAAKTRACEAFRAGTLSLGQALRDSLEQPDGLTSFDWALIPEDERTKLAQVMDAMAAAVDGPSALPHTEPATTLDLTPLCVVGRTLAPETQWFVLEGETWRVSDAATRAFFIDGVVSPAFDPSTSRGPTFLGEYQGFRAVFEVFVVPILPVIERFTSAYSSTR